jgi:hypothetical protein
MAAFPPEPMGPEDDLTIRGEIGDTSVAALLRSLLGSGETGILTLRNGDVAKSIFIRAGRVLYAASTNVDERLGEDLLLRGRITARQYLEASRMIRPGRRLGGILVELAALDPEELIPAVEHQVKEMLMDLFTWTHGSYELVIKDLDPEPMIALKISTENLILEGIVEKFNQMFGRIYVFLQGRLGSEVDGFMDGVLDDVSRQYGSLFAGVDLKQYGRADFEQMLANIADLPPEQRKSLMLAGLNELVFVIQLSVRTRFGREEESVVSGIIKDGFRKLGPRG